MGYSIPPKVLACVKFHVYAVFALSLLSSQKNHCLLLESFRFFAIELIHSRRSWLLSSPRRCTYLKIGERYVLSNFPGVPVATGSIPTVCVLPFLPLPKSPPLLSPA